MREQGTAKVGALEFETSVSRVTRRPADVADEGGQIETEARIGELFQKPFDTIRNIVHKSMSGCGSASTS